VCKKNNEKKRKKKTSRHMIFINVVQFDVVDTALLSEYEYVSILSFGYLPAVCTCIFFACTRISGGGSTFHFHFLPFSSPSLSHQSRIKGCLESQFLVPINKHTHPKKNEREHTHILQPPASRAIIIEKSVWCMTEEVFKFILLFFCLTPKAPDAPYLAL